MIPLASIYLPVIFPTGRFDLLILLYTILLPYNTLYVTSLSTDIGLLGGLFQITLFNLLIYQTHNTSLLSFIPLFKDDLLAAPVIIYSNAATNKIKVLRGPPSGAPNR